MEYHVKIIQFGHIDTTCVDAPCASVRVTGLFRVAYGILLVYRTLVFMSCGAVDASFPMGDSSPRLSSPEAAAESGAGLVRFGHGFLGGAALGSPSAEAVRSACWCLCAAGAAVTVGFRPNAVIFAASLMQVRSCSYVAGACCVLEWRLRKGSWYFQWRGRQRGRMSAGHVGVGSDDVKLGSLVPLLGTISRRVEDLGMASDDTFSRSPRNSKYFAQGL